MSLEQISASLDDIRQALEASGFNLELDQPGDRSLTVTVRPGPEACHECLVPKPTFKRIVLDSIGTVTPAPPSVTVRYPADLA
ncbi:MAG: hypothetical protein JWO75_5715 [Actinomycetia bacterium]|jgi:hypothetical protein|nr:hypothetical protein [Actinomycetes bacterium]